IFCGRYRICADLAHLVDGRIGRARRVHYHAGFRISWSGRGRDIGSPDCPVLSHSARGGCLMNVAISYDQVGRDSLPSASEAGPADKRIVVGFGFWIFLLSDIVMFSALFAAYAVLVKATAGGPTGAQLFHESSVAI